jgi:hypothetical protein
LSGHGGNRQQRVPFRLTQTGEGTIFLAMRRLSVLAAAAAATLLLGSCSIRQEVHLEPSGSGTVTMRITLQKLFMDYIADLSELSGKQNSGEVFDIESIKKGFAERSDVELKRIATPTPDVLEMDLAFRSIEQIFTGQQKLQGPVIVTLTKAGDSQTLRFHLDRENFAQVTEFLPFLKGPLFEGLGPQEGDNTTEAEYLELMDLALGAGGAAALKASVIETQISVKGKVVSQTGGTVAANGSSVTYKVPLIRVLLLDKPLDYSLTFK